ncbi:MAG TPA: TetR/AcrR family transcriptional regulator [Actinomycetota bacterium]|nr:TetR/AcrR family transcriptional regulator [Actinomycetota bacterium]
MVKRAEYLGPERRRPLVLDAAESIFAEGGFSDASMSAIAERAEVSKAVLYDCFPGGKQEIYYALLDRCEQSFMAYINEVLDRTNRMPLHEGLMDFFTAFLNYARENPLAFRIMFGEAGTSDREIAKRAQRSKEFMVAKMGERTRQIMTDAGVRITPLADMYNISMVAVAEELARWILRDDNVPQDKLVKATVLWLMKGFETIIPSDTWRRPLPD